MAFAHLHVHTEYSLLDGSSKIPEIVARAKALGMDSLAITDHGAMYGVIDFYKACQSEGIHPVLGCEVYVAEKSRFQKDGRADAEYYHLVLLAENQTGYENLIKLVSKGFIEGFYYKPRIDHALLEEYHEGLIALSACLAGEVPRCLLARDYEKAKETALYYSRVMGPDHFYLELQDHGIAEQAVVNQQLVRLSQETGLALVCTNDVHYTLPEDAEPHDVLLCIQTGKTINDPNRMRYEGGQFYLKSPQEMAERFPYAPQALENTEKIAQRCQVDFTFHETKLPAFATPAPYTSPQYLRMLCEQGLRERYGEVTPELQERLQYELDVIERMGYVDYFLIVSDFIHYAKSKDIMVGPGRGSAAGSVVAYTLHITDIEPIRYNLIFERFLNPERVSMPDIDVDFCYRRRPEVIEYVQEKYGKEAVTQIITFGTMAARQVIRDVGRAMALPYGEADKISKMIPQELNMTIDKALTLNPELAAAYESDETVRKLINVSKRLEGLPRHASTHAAGVVIAKRPVMDYVPLATNDGAPVTQFNMTTIEELGLLKMDFLGLRTLTVIQDAVRFIEQNTGRKIDLARLPLDDREVYAMIGAGKTVGVFQLESAGMTSFMKELKPETLEDIIAGISLFRPGPMDFIPRYLKGKREPKAISYLTPELEPILSPTYGCIVYQEQVMQIVQRLAGYSMGRADLVRKAMSKKKADVMAKEREVFIHGNPAEGVLGCEARGISAQIASQIFDEMTDFAKYAFNKAHAACYAVVAYQTAWLKAHYPAEYMAALMTSVIGMPAKELDYIRSLSGMGIALEAPDINESETGFSVKNHRIRYGLSAVKGVGEAIVDRLVEEREKNGPFCSLRDFCRRMQGADLNRKVLENLIKAGAFDSLGGTRKAYMTLSDIELSQAQNWHKSRMSGQVDLFDFADADDAQDSEMKEDDLKDDLRITDEYLPQQKLAFEHEVLGFYLSGHPLQEDEAVWRSHVTRTAGEFLYDEENGAPLVKDGEMATIGGIILDVKTKITKNNQMMAFLTLEDLYGAVEVVVFSRTYEQMRAFLAADAKIYVEGRVDATDDADAKLIAQSVVPFGRESELAPIQPTYRKFYSAKPKVLYLKLDNQKAMLEKKDALMRLLKRFPGPGEVIFYMAEEKLQLKAPKDCNTAQDSALTAELQQMLGESNVVWK